MALPEIDFPVAPHRLSGVVYGCLLNHRPALAALGDAVNAAPYKAGPKAPVLYVKPRNTLAGDGATPPPLPVAAPTKAHRACARNTAPASMPDMSVTRTATS